MFRNQLVLNEVFSWIIKIDERPKTLYVAVVGPRVEASNRSVFRTTDHGGGEGMRTGAVQVQVGFPLSEMRFVVYRLRRSVHVDVGLKQ